MTIDLQPPVRHRTPRVRNKSWRCLLNIETLESRALPSVATLLTDKPDYSPGETALITGDGFQEGETIDLRVVRTDGLPDYPQGNQPWQVTDGGAGDLDGVLNGSFQTTWYVEEQYAGATLLATATGLTSGLFAECAFTDAATSANITSPTGANPVTVSGLPGTVRISFDYSTSNDSGTTSGVVEVKNAGGALVASASSPLPNAKLLRSDFIDVTIPAGTAAGSYSVTVTINYTNASGNNTDSKDDTEANAIIVAASPPDLQPIPPQTIDELTQLTFQAVATDPDLPNDTLTFSLANAPPGAAINGTTGVFSWTPAENQDGVHQFTVVVTDSGGNTDSETVQVTVNEVNVAPTIVSATPAPNPVVKTTAVTFTAVATDPDTINPGAQPNTLAFSLVGAPTGAAIDAATGVFSWTPGFDDDGTFTFTVRVTDNGNPNLYDDETVSITTTAAGIVAGDLYVVGKDSAADTLVTVTTDSTEAFVNGVSAGVFAGFDGIIIRGGNGSDTVSIQGWTGPALIEGSAGNDTVSASGHSDYTLSTTSLTSSDGLNAALGSIENVNLLGSGATPVTVSGWSGTGLSVSGAGPVVLNDVSAGSGGIAIAASTILVNGPVISTAGGALTLDGAVTVAQGGSITADGDLSFTHITATGALPLTSTAGNITIGVIDAAGFTVTLTAGGAIIDGNGPLNNITAHTLLMAAGAGIASAADPLESAGVSFLNAQGGTGGVFVDNTGDLTVTGASATGTIDIRVHSDLIIGGQVTSTSGDVTLVATDGTLTVPQDTVVAAGDLELTAAIVDADLTGASFGDATFSSGVGGSSLNIAEASFGTATFNGASFDIDATDATFGAASFAGINFDIDASGAIFASFDVDADGFDLDAAGATFASFDVDANGFLFNALGASFTGLTSFRGSAFDIDALGANFAAFDVDADGFDLDAAGAQFGAALFKGTNFDIDATGATFTAVQFDSDAIGFDFEAEGFDIDAAGATFGLFDVDGFGFDVDAVGAVFTQFDVDAEGFDIDATGATFGTAAFTGKNFDIDATDARFTGQVLFDSDAIGFDAEAEGFDIDATDATFGQVFFVGNGFDVDAFDFDLDGTGAVFAHFDVDGVGFDVDADGAVFTSFDVDGSGF
ncbi:MAG: cadherin-like domain-containing protein, partial [Gemmataceae bacterium]|nr:cadherin-like domain-containing protein [Gemmataceae bacterium]